MPTFCGHYANIVIQVLHCGYLHSAIWIKNHIALLYTLRKIEEPPLFPDYAVDGVNTYVDVSSYH